jgi:hypothetical protein
MSSTLSIATPAIPTSPVTRGWSESYLFIDRVRGRGRGERGWWRDGERERERESESERERERESESESESESEREGEEEGEGVHGDPVEEDLHVLHAVPPSPHLPSHEGGRSRIY